MPRSKSDQPGYRYHVSGQAVVSFCGKNFYLGEFDSPESRAKYYALLAEYIAGGKTRAPEADEHQADQPITVRCITGEFREHIKTKYANNANELSRFKNLCTTLDDEHGDEPASEFGPRKLAELRELFVVSGNSRAYTNKQTRNIVRIFQHAVSRELVTPDRLVALQSLEALRYGQTKARESEPVVAVDIEAVRLTAKHLSPTIKAMIRVQVATGMRPTELCMMRPCDIERRSDGVWVYRPATHKTKHRGKVKEIPLIADAKRALRPFMDRDDDVFCFSPQESARWFRDQRTAARTTKHGPGRNRPGTNRKPNPKRQPGLKFTSSSYRRAIQRAAEKAGTDSWFPYQIRHTAASVVREALGVEAAQALLGHSRASMTEHYAKVSLNKAIEAAKVAPTIG